MRRFLLLVSLISLTIGCRQRSSSDDDGGGSLTNPFLSTGDLTVGSKIRPLTAADAQRTIESESSLMDDSPSTGSHCVGDLMDALVVHATAGAMEIGGDIDIAACLKSMLDSETAARIASAGVRLATAMTCEGVDLSVHDGKTIKSLGDSGDLCVNGTATTHFTHMKLAMNYTWQEAGRSYSAQYVTINATTASDGGHCRFKLEAGSSTSLDCTHTERSFWSSSKVDGKETKAENVEDVVRFVYKNLVSAKGTANKWYQSGSMDAVVNDWTGTVTYKDVTTAPTYTLNKDGETVAGIISGGGAELNLQGVSQSPFPLKRPNLMRGLKGLK